MAMKLIDGFALHLFQNYINFRSIIVLGFMLDMYRATILVFLIILSASETITVDNNLVGDFTIADPLGTQFQSALLQALTQSSKYLRSDLVLTETQVVAGTNFRFTFRNQDGSLSQVVIYVPLEPSEDVPPTGPSPLGGFNEVTDGSYSIAAEAIYSKFPEMRSYGVSGVELQIVAGSKYRIGFQSHSNDSASIKYACFQVLVGLNGVSSIQEVERINVSGYTVGQISDIYSRSLELHPEVNIYTGYVLSRIENIWPLSQAQKGLQLIFVSGIRVRAIYIFKDDSGNEVNTINVVK